MSLQSLAAGIAGLDPAEGMDICLLWVLFCQVEVSATGRSLVQRSPTKCVCVYVSFCVIRCNNNLYTYNN